MERVCVERVLCVRVERVWSACVERVWSAWCACVRSACGARGVRAAPMWAGPQEAPRKRWRHGGVHPLLPAEPLVDGGRCDQTGFRLALMRSGYPLTCELQALHSRFSLFP